MQSTAPSSTEQLRLLDPAARSRVPVRVWLVLFGWSLTVSGDMSLDEWEPLVIEALRGRYPNGRTAQKAVKEAKALFRFLRARGAGRLGDVTPELVSEWLWAARHHRGSHRPPAQSTVKNRQWAARSAFEAAEFLGAPIDPQALIGEPVARPSKFMSARPLTGEEAQHLRANADADLLSSGSLLVALALAGGSATEIAAVRLRDLNLDTAEVAFGGESARVNPLGEWSARVIRLWLLNQPNPLNDDDLLCVGEGLSADQAAHSVTVRLSRLLRDVGLAGRSGVTARSIRLTTAREVLEAEGIEAAALFLGSVSLDTTVTSLRHNWRCRDG